MGHFDARTAVARGGSKSTPSLPPVYDAAVSTVSRLQFALQHIQTTDWPAFEQLASAFAAADFPDLRTIAGIGDEGRDAVFSAVETPPIVVQYSIAEDWASKIRHTLKRLDEADHRCSSLIYLTNRKIGAAADKLKAELLVLGVALDIRDRAYFIDRVDQSGRHRNASEEFADRIISPLLPAEDLIRSSPVADPHLRAGLLYLELQMRDMDSSRNITRLSYEALVLAAINETDPEHRMTRTEIVAAVVSVLPGRDREDVSLRVDGALGRLRKHSRVNFTGKDKTYNLHFTERRRRDDQALELLAEREAAQTQLVNLTRSVSFELEIPLAEERLEAFIDHLERLFEIVLERQGNEFAEAVRLQTSNSLRQDVLKAAEDLVSSTPGIVGSFKIGRDALVDLLVGAMDGALLLGGAVRTRLRQLADSYTLLAFMRETTDVQHAVSEFFSRGTLVFDTTALLPCFGESLLKFDDQSYTNLIRGALDAGLTLCTTSGVCNEIYSHLMRADTCSRLGPAWEGPIPLVYEDWLRLGGQGSFASFVQGFAGDGGEEDIQLFLERGLGFRVTDLEQAADRVEESVRYEVAELWRPRKRIKLGGSEMERDILLRHDLEMYFGVLGMRKDEARDLYGYEAWWVTEDGSGLGMFKLAGDAGVELRSDPCMSPTFLSTMLAIGPSRRMIASQLRTQLPVVLAAHQQGYGSQALSGLANEIRAEFANEPEWLIRRRIRDRMNQIKQSGGAQFGDTNGMLDEVLMESADAGSHDER